MNTLGFPHLLRFRQTAYEVMKLLNRDAEADRGSAVK